MHKFSFKRHFLGQSFSKFAIFPDNCPKTQQKILKNLKIPANPLPFSCQKNVQTTSLDYKYLLDYFHTCDVTSAVAASSGNSASTSGGSVASGSGRAMGAPASNSTPLGLPPMPQNFPPTEIQALLSQIDIWY